MDPPALVRKLHDEGRYREALKAARQVFRIQPKHASTLFWVSSCHGALRHPRRALYYARRAVAAAPFDIDHRVWLAEVHAWRGERRKALQAIREALALAPESLYVHRKKASVLLDVRLYGEAAEAAKDALRLDPTDQGSRDLLAQALTHLGQHEDAAGVTKTALRDDPMHQPAHARLGWIELTGGAGGEAVAHFREALRLNPLDANAQEGLLHAMRARFFLYRWLFRMVFWHAARPRWFRLTLTVGGFYALAWLSTASPDPLKTVAALLAFAWLLVWGFGHRLVRPFIDLILRFHPRAWRIMTRKDIVMADFLGIVLWCILVGALPMPKAAKSALLLLPFAAIPVWHAATWPNPVSRRKLWFAAAVGFLLPVGFLSAALVAFRAFAPLAVVSLILGWLGFLYRMAWLARKEGL